NPRVLGRRRSVSNHPRGQDFFELHPVAAELHEMPVPPKPPTLRKLVRRLGTRAENSEAHPLPGDRLWPLPPSLLPIANSSAIVRPSFCFRSLRRLPKNVLHHLFEASSVPH